MHSSTCVMMLLTAAGPCEPFLCCTRPGTLVPNTGSPATTVTQQQEPRFLWQHKQNINSTVPAVSMPLSLSNHGCEERGVHGVRSQKIMGGGHLHHFLLLSALDVMLYSDKRRQWVSHGRSQVLAVSASVCELGVSRGIGHSGGIEPHRSKPGVTSLLCEFQHCVLFECTKHGLVVYSGKMLDESYSVIFRIACMFTWLFCGGFFCFLFFPAAQQLDEMENH